MPQTISDLLIVLKRIRSLRSLPLAPRFAKRGYNMAHLNIECRQILFKNKASAGHPEFIIHHS
jgi:hypothetical protein